MLLYLHGRVKIVVNLGESLVPQEFRALRKCLWPSFLDGHAIAAAA